MEIKYKVRYCYLRDRDIGFKRIKLTFVEGVNDMGSITQFIVQLTFCILSFLYRTIDRKRKFSGIQFDEENLDVSQAGEPANIEKLNPNKQDLREGTKKAPSPMQDKVDYIGQDKTPLQEKGKTYEEDCGVTCEDQAGQLTVQLLVFFLLQSYLNVNYSACHFSTTIEQCTCIVHNNS